MTKNLTTDPGHENLPHDPLDMTGAIASPPDKSDSQHDINSVVALYSPLNSHDDNRKRALLLLMIRSWITALCDFDPFTGEALPTSITDLVNRIVKLGNTFSQEGVIKDRIYRIVSHAHEAIKEISEHTRTHIAREHNLLPIYAAREVDVNSIQWLSRKPGRTIREKLSGKPYIKAVQRKASVDSSENRLFKVCMRLLEQTLQIRQSNVKPISEDICEDQLILSQRWLRSDEASEVGVWTNLPPNNVLLQDKLYRKIWDAWLWLQDIDDKIAGDNQRLEQDYLHVIFGSVLSSLYQSGRFRLVQQPVVINWDEFSILPAMKVVGCIIPDSTLGGGYVVYINQNKKWGKLEIEDNEELFFHKSGLSPSLRIDTLKVGDLVSYDLGTNDKGVCAINIQLIQEEIRYYDFEISDKTFRIKEDNLELIVEASLDSIIIRTCPETKTREYGYSNSELDEIVCEIMSLLRIETDSGSSADDAVDEQYWDESTLDICSIRPLYINSQGYQVPLTKRLLIQYWPNSEPIDCGSSNAIMLGQNIVSISMRSLFFQQHEIAAAQINSIAMQFAYTIKESVKANRLTYLVPDFISEFDWESIRRAVNFYYPEAAPLPKSIATIMAWHTSERFVNDEVRDNDMVLVLDHSDDGIIVTPIQAVFNQNLLKILPESRGITWDRHPSYIIQDKRIFDTMEKNLSGCCEQANELLKLFGFSGLISDAGILSIVNDKEWCHLPKSVHDILIRGLDDHTITRRNISDCLKSTSKRGKANSIFILPTEDTIRNPDDFSPYKWLGPAWSPLEGSLSLNKWQSIAEGIALWRDHLPELSIEIVVDGHFENFYLVKDSTVIPQRGEKVDIPIKETFNLPAGQPHYKFPLQQGEGKRKLQFMAYLRSPSFPLKKSISCKLHMTYTYGADDPYELIFIPIDTIDFGIKPIRVEWRQLAEIESSNISALPVPTFPPPKAWRDFQKYPKKDSNTFSNLMDWCELKLSRLDSQIVNDPKGYLKQVINRRKTGYFEWGSYDKNNKYYCRVNVDGVSVFCHSSDFLEDVDFDLLPEGLPVYLDVRQTSKGYNGINITISEVMPQYMLDRYGEYINSEIDAVRKAIYDLRFPVITMWNNGHTLSEPDVPGNFRSIMLQHIEQAQAMLQSDSINDELKHELFFFLSCLHRDTPLYVANRLQEATKDRELLVKYSRNIAYAIGTADLPWQANLFSYAIDPQSKDVLVVYITLEILAIALWRSKDLIYRVTADELKNINQSLLNQLRYHLSRYKNKNKDQNLYKLCRLLELLLALLRTRGMGSDRMNSILAPNSQLAQELVTIIDDLSKVLVERRAKLNTRISLSLNKPSSFKKTPDLLYALRMYLTGDSGAGTISVNQINDVELSEQGD